MCRTAWDQPASLGEKGSRIAVTSGRVSMLSSRRDTIVQAADALVEDARPAPQVVADVLELLQQPAEQEGADIVLEVLNAVAARAGREARTVPDALAWLGSLRGGRQLVRVLAALDAPLSADPFAAALALYVTREAAHRALHVAAPVTADDANVESMERALVHEWRRTRKQHPHEWLYHPRRTSLSDVVARKFLLDLMGVSPALVEDARAGSVACDLNVTLTSGPRHKKLDLVIGEPLEPPGPAPDPSNPLRKARLRSNLMTLEVKACMTSHRQATPRLLDELRSSLEVVKGAEFRTIPIAIVVINVAPTFTNPLNTPGPNQHRPSDIARLFSRLAERVRLARGTSPELAYGGIAIVPVDTDNEHRIVEAKREGRVPPTHTYERAIARAAQLYQSIKSTASP